MIKFLRLFLSFLCVPLRLIFALWFIVKKHIVVAGYEYGAKFERWIVRK